MSWPSWWACSRRSARPGSRGRCGTSVLSPLPWGLALAALSAAALIVLSAVFGRGPAFAAVLGWATGVVLWLVRPGEAVIASDTLGYAFLLVPSVVLLIAATLSAPAFEESSR